MEYLYHGSSVPGIIELEARSHLHSTGAKVVYLTSSIPYALFYIWDSARTGYSGKHVTGSIRSGVAVYEEQFPDQLKTFYQGVSGYLYRIPFTDEVQAINSRDGLFFQTGNAVVAGVEFIPDVYAELLKYEASGQLRVLRFTEQSSDRQEELISLIAEAIRRSSFYENDEAHRSFMMKHFAQAWRKAHEQQS